MAAYNLNEELKAREAAKRKEETGSSEKALDDVSRVKVLSPGRKVFKRFIRNRLAVFGSVTLIILFAFSFLGPLVYRYKQSQIFYKYDSQNVNYALAQANTSFNGYALDETAEPELRVVNSMNSNIKKMVEADQVAMAVVGESGNYTIRKTADNIYELNTASLTEVATIGNGDVEVGTFDAIRKSIDFKGQEVEGLADAAVKAKIKGVSGTFSFNGEEYTYQRLKGKSYTLSVHSEGLRYSGGDLGDEFADAANAAAESGQESAYFTVGDQEYFFVKDGSNAAIYSAADEKPVMVYSLYTMDPYETGMNISDAFKAACLDAVSKGGEFTVDGASYSVKDDGDVLTVLDADGNEYAELSLFSIRRYTGEDTMEYGLKKAIAEAISGMNASGEKTVTINADLPLQGENGQYVYDDDGNLQYNPTDMKITQRETGQYVINCEQINYVIDIYAKPSLKHPLGTDGDGFDVMARIMYGGRVSLMVGFIVVFLEIAIGVIMGGLAGYYGGWVDNLIMRLVDIFYCLPTMPIMIILGAMMDAKRMATYPRLMVMMAALGIMGWASVARLVRGQILMLRDQEFMIATEATGIKVRHRIFRHLIPNVIPQLIVIATMGIGGVILTESTLSFLGLGVKHPLATWGTIINSVSSASAMAHYAFIWIPVGLLICLTVIAFNFVGDGLRDAYDPKSKR